MLTSGAQGDSSGPRRLVSGSHGDRTKWLTLLCIRSAAHRILKSAGGT
jgi:hypothetical protein